MRKPGTVENVAIEAGIWEATASDSWLQGATIALHCKRPCRPNRARSKDAVCNVEESVDGEGAGRETLKIVLIVKAGVQMIVSGQRRSIHVSSGGTTYSSYLSTQRMNPHRTSSTWAFVISKSRQRLTR